MKLTKKINKYLTTAKIIILALILSVGVSVVYAWVGPTAAPYGNDAATPVNVSSISQTKAGPFWATVLGATVGAYINGLLETISLKTTNLQMTGGSPGLGKVLTAADNQGNAFWSNTLVPSSLSCQTITVSGTGTVTANCSAGIALTGGGGSCPSSSIKSSQPIGSNWEVSCQVSGPVTAYAICCQFLYPAIVP